jgi:hypothetical protein
MIPWPFRKYQGPTIVECIDRRVLSEKAIKNHLAKRRVNESCGGNAYIEGRLSCGAVNNDSSELEVAERTKCP